MIDGGFRLLQPAKRKSIRASKQTRPDQRRRDAATHPSESIRGADHAVTARKATLLA